MWTNTTLLSTGTCTVYNCFLFGSTNKWRRIFFSRTLQISYISPIAICRQDLTLCCNTNPLNYCWFCFLYLIMHNYCPSISRNPHIMHLWCFVSVISFLVCALIHINTNHSSLLERFSLLIFIQNYRILFNSPMQFDV